MHGGWIGVGREYSSDGLEHKEPGSESGGEKGGQGHGSDGGQGSSGERLVSWRRGED